MASCKVLQDIPLRAQFRLFTGFPFQDFRLTMIRSKGTKIYIQFLIRSSVCVPGLSHLSVSPYTKWHLVPAGTVTVNWTSFPFWTCSYPTVPLTVGKFNDTSWRFAGWGLTSNCLNPPSSISHQRTWASSPKACQTLRWKNCPTPSTCQNNLPTTRQENLINKKGLSFCEDTEKIWIFGKGNYPPFHLWTEI